MKIKNKVAMSIFLLGMISMSEDIKLNTNILRGEQAIKDILKDASIYTKAKEFNDHYKNNPNDNYIINTVRLSFVDKQNNNGPVGHIGPGGITGNDSINMHYNNEIVREKRFDRVENINLDEVGSKLDIYKPLYDFAIADENKEFIDYIDGKDIYDMVYYYDDNAHFFTSAYGGENYNDMPESIKQRFDVFYKLLLDSNLMTTYTGASGNTYKNFNNDFYTVSLVDSKDRALVFSGNSNKNVNFDMDGIVLGNGNNLNSAPKYIILGSDNTVENNNESKIIGNENTVYGENNLIFGNKNNVGNDKDNISNNNIIIGNEVNISKDVNDSIVFGNNSTAISNAVSIGSAGKERKIHFLEDGEISENSKEAINGSQLYAIANASSTEINADKWREKLGINPNGDVIANPNSVEYTNAEKNVINFGKDNVPTSLKNVANPTDDLDAVNKKYVDEITKNIAKNVSSLANNAAAMANIPQVAGDRLFSLGAGTSYSGNKVASFALGISGQDYNKRVIYKASVGISTDKKWTVAAGLSLNLGKINSTVYPNEKIDKIEKQNNELMMQNRMLESKLENNINVINSTSEEKRYIIDNFKFSKSTITK